MNDDIKDYMENSINYMLKIAELQTQIGKNLVQIGHEIKAIQDAVADVHEAVTTKWEK